MASSPICKFTWTNSKIPAFKLERPETVTVFVNVPFQEPAADAVEFEKTWEKPLKEYDRRINEIKIIFFIIELVLKKMKL